MQQAKQGSKSHIALLAACGVLVITVAGLGIWGIAKSVSSAKGPSVSIDPMADQNYDKNEDALDANQLGATILLETEDAGQEYIDETLFIGDSNTVRTMMYGHTTWDNVVAAVSMGIQHVPTLKLAYFVGYKDPLTVPQAVKVIQPKRIIITYGTNNTIGWSTDKFIENYKVALKAIAQAYPYADIIINSVPPIDKERENMAVTMQTIDKFNKALAEMAKEEEYKFLNTAEVLKDPATGFAKKDYTIGDGIHLSKKGMEAMFSYIRTHSYITPDNRPKPLKKVPKREETPTGIISNDPLAVRGGKKTVTFLSSDTALGTIDGETQQKVKQTLTCSEVYANAKVDEGAIFTGWSTTHGNIVSPLETRLQFTVPKMPDDQQEVTITANFKKAQVTIQYNTQQTSALTMDKGHTLQLVAGVDADFKGDKTITWKSDDTSVATVDTQGNVKAVSGGTTNITASILDGKISAVCKITVNQPLESISITGQDTLQTGQTTQLSLQLNPTAALADKSKAVWSSSDETIATVSSTGLVTAKDKEGNATITCTLEGKTAQFIVKITIPKPLTGISLSGPNEVFEGATIQLNVKYNPADTTDSKTAQWSSDNEGVASVKDGVITGHASGTATITCTVGSHTATHTISVKQEPNYVDSVSIDPGAITINVGGSAKLTASYTLKYPSRPDGVDVSTHWSCNNDYITVSPDGTITARNDLTDASGMLTSVVTVTIGSKTASCTVTITVPVPPPAPEPSPSADPPSSEAVTPPTESEPV